jgi:serine/threonine-protein kinase
MNDLPEDPALIAILDDYLAQLQAGRSPDRSVLLHTHPELASAIRCLDALENMSAIAEPEGMDDLPENGEETAEDKASLRHFGQYEILGEIGRGGMGVVYKARQPSLDRVVAIKMILASHLASAEHVRRFQIEARAAARLRHSNIVQIHEVGQCDGQHYFAMEYIEGESLAQRIARQSPPIDATVRLLGSVARAVEHLHQQGIVHRDLKPSNILLDRNDQPYVTDFGLAKVFEPGSEMTATGVIAGTPSYMAPEQASGRTTEVGPSADIYSLGAILYELLTGEPPFRQESPLDTLLDIMGREPTLPRRLNPQVPRGLELICLKCLAKSPEDRYASAGALADELDRFARGEPLQARPPHLGQRLLQWTRRQPALASRLGALGLFYLVELANYASGVVSRGFQEKTSVILAIWAGVSIICQQFLDVQRWSVPARFVWGILDSVLLLCMLLFVADGAASALVVVYPLLIAASGLWFRMRFVWSMTALSLLSYGIVVVDFYQWRPELQDSFDISISRHVIFAVSLFVLGAIVSYLVQRVRTLSAFCGRPLP